MKHLKKLNDNAAQKDVAANIKKHLKHLFPKTKFSVKSAYTGCIEVSWVDGQNETAVSEAVKVFSTIARSDNGSFDVIQSSDFNKKFGGVRVVSTFRTITEACYVSIIEELKEETTPTGKYEVNYENFMDGKLIDVEFDDQFSWQGKIRSIAFNRTFA